MAMLIKYKESEMGLQLKIQNNMSLIKIYFHLWNDFMRHTYTCIAYDYVISYAYVSYKNKIIAKMWGLG